MNASLEHRIMWFLMNINPNLNGIKIVHVPFEIEHPRPFNSVKFEMQLTTDHITAFWSPTNKVFELIEPSLIHFFGIELCNVMFNNTKTVFWFNVKDIEGELPT